MDNFEKFDSRALVIMGLKAIAQGDIGTFIRIDAIMNKRAAAEKTMMSESEFFTMESKDAAKRVIERMMSC